MDSTFYTKTSTWRLSDIQHVHFLKLKKNWKRASAKGKLYVHLNWQPLLDIKSYQITITAIYP